jgi:hypothetical protein
MGWFDRGGLFGELVIGFCARERINSHPPASPGICEKHPFDQLNAREEIHLPTGVICRRFLPSEASIHIENTRYFLRDCGPPSAGHIGRPCRRPAK